MTFFTAYVLFLMMMVGLAGVGVEGILLYSLYKRKPHYLAFWYVATIVTFLLSIALALNFLLGIFEIPSKPSVGKNFVFDAFCVLYHVVFFLIPEYLFGPRLQTVLTAIVMLLHLCLPVFHFYSYLVVRAYYRVVRDNEYYNSGAQGGPMMDANGIEASAPPRKCQKCMLAAQENATNGVYQCSTPLVQPIETTC